MSEGYSPKTVGIDLDRLTGYRRQSSLAEKAVMKAPNNTEGDDALSVKELQNALNQESQNVTRAAELRIRELTALSNEYAAGALSPAEATEKYMRYLDKWGDPFPGLSKTAANLSDDQIHQEMERNLDGHASRVQSKRGREI